MPRPGPFHFSHSVDYIYEFCPLPDPDVGPSIFACDERIQCVFPMTLFLPGFGISISWTLGGRVPGPPGKCRRP